MKNLQELVQHLIKVKALKTLSIISAFEKTDRIGFIFPEHRHLAYEDFPLTIGYGATISQPYTVAFMMELLQPKKGEKILDIGSGSGWTTALLGEMVGNEGKVFGTEIVPELVEFGAKNLEKYKLSWVKIIQADEKKLGLPKEAPFNKILVSATAWKTPQELINQLASPGRLVIPIRNSVWQIDKDEKGEVSLKEFPGFAFVPLK